MLSFPRLRFAVALTLAALHAAPPLASQSSARQRAWRAHVRLAERSPFKDLRWRAVGPRLQGGRIEAIALHPVDPKTIYVGPGSGNLWKTTNDGLSWKPIFEQESSFAIGDIAIAPSDPRVVWVGTGETQPRHSGYSYAGTGVFKSVDGGRSWKNTGLWDSQHIGKLLVHPKNAEHVYVAAIGPFWSDGGARGIFETRDGGKSWKRLPLPTGRRLGAVDIAMHPSDPRVLYAAAWQLPHGPQSALYRSLDGGASWQKMTRGLPQGPLGRAGLAVCPRRPDTVYAFLDNHGALLPSNNAGSQGEKKRGRARRKIPGAELYRSDDRGVTWRKTHDDDLYKVFTIYGWKFCDVSVNPQDVDEVFILGNRAYHSRDGGRSFERVGEKILRLHDTRGRILHLDHHELVIDPRDPQRLLLGNDGGLFRSTDRGRTWLHLNNLPIGEFYFVAVDEREPYRIFGGTQDNAALYGPAKAIEEHQNDPWKHVFLDPWTGGDAFVTLPDPTREHIVYYEHQHGAMRTMDLRGEIQSWGPSAKGIRPRAPEGAERWRFAWYAPFLSSKFDPRTLIAGGNKVVRSRDRGETWKAISPDLSDEAGGERARVPAGTITMLSESPRRAGLLYAGNEGGALYVTRDDGARWDEVGRAHGLPAKWVSRVVASRHVDARVYVAQHGFREDDFACYLHASDDGGQTWRSIHEGLPAQAIHVIREDPQNPSILYVGGDLGVYASHDCGKTWQSLRANLPTTPVHDLVVHEKAREIVIGTHGRSIFVLDARPIQNWKK